MKDSSQHDDSSYEQAYSKSPFSKRTFAKEGEEEEEGMFSRTVILRCSVVAGLVTSALICGFVTFKIMRELEREVGVQTYESVASSALIGAQDFSLRKIQGGAALATVLRYAFPDKDKWPFVALNGFEDIAGRIGELSSSLSQVATVFVDRKDQPAFEKFVKDLYEERNYPENAGVSDFGFGIWAPSKDSPYEDGRVHDINGTKSNRSIVAPLYQHNSPSSSSLLLNVLSFNIGPMVESMILCSKQFLPNDPNMSPSCGATSDITMLVRFPNRPASLIYQPIFPANDPQTLVGLTGTSIYWDEALTSIVPDYVDGMVCVLSTATKTYSYIILGGKPEVIGEGDHHDRRYNKFKRSIVLNSIETNTTLSATFTLTVYPSDAVFDAFATNSPLVVSLGFVAVICFCICLFFLYDFFMKHEAHQQRQLLKLKRRFVRFISHEIRTPLNTVGMGLELLLNELGASNTGKVDRKSWSKLRDETALFRKVGEIVSLASEIRDNNENAVSVLNDLLNFDKIQTGTLKLEIAVVRIWEQVKKTAVQFQIQANGKKITLGYKTVSTDGHDIEAASSGELEPLVVMGDDMKLNQAVRNLISNALKFTPEKGKVTVSTKHDPYGLPSRNLSTFTHNGVSYPQAGSITISVADTGAGMSAEQLDLLFNEWVQFDPNKLQGGGGSGLGLCITKEIVEQHGGKIWALSDGLGKGAEFLIELPLYRGPLLEKSPLSPDNHLGTTISPHVFQEENKKRRVLVAEDVTTNLKFLIRLLEKAGHSCGAAKNGREAVDCIKDDLAKSDDHVPYDTILMDFEMPVLNGPEATKEIRNLGFSGFIIGVTGNVLPEDVEHFKQQGADGVLAKPIRITALDEFWGDRNF